jgi:hypothetical protein
MGMISILMTYNIYNIHGSLFCCCMIVHVWLCLCFMLLIKYQVCVLFIPSTVISLMFFVVHLKYVFICMSWMCLRSRNNVRLTPITYRFVILFHAQCRFSLVLLAPFSMNNADTLPFIQMLVVPLYCFQY